MTDKTVLIIQYLRAKNLPNCDIAADTIEQLQARVDELEILREHRDQLRAQRDDLKAENTRMREALGVMADHSRFWREVQFQTGTDRRQYAQQLLVELDKAEALKN